jgi:hypothetical protein
MNALAAVRTRPFYTGLSILMVLIALAGFWPGYVAPLFDGSLVKTVRVHGHAILFTGWLLLFFVQAALAALGKTRWHIRLGQFGIAYGILLIPNGLHNAIVRAIALSRGFYREFLDMLFFAIFFGAAVAYRRKAQLHKRFMIVASTMLLVAPVSRLWFLAGLPAGTARLTVIFSILALPVILAIAYDAAKKQRIHPVYLAGIFAFLVRVFSPAYVADTSVWLTLERAVLSFFG